MSNAFAEFKKSQKAKVGLGKLQEQFDKVQGGGFVKDDRIWAPKVNESKESFSVIRLLPPKKMNDDAPFVKRIRFYLTGPGGKFQEYSPASIGLPCPVMEHYRRLWNEDNEEEARKFSPINDFFFNCVVLKDKAAPEHEWEKSGKVYLFRATKKLFDKIKEKCQSKFEDEDEVDVFNIYTGMNLKIKTKADGKWINYHDLSEFAAESALFDGDDEEIMKVFEKMYDLQELVKPELFKSYEDLKKGFFQAMGWDLDDEEHNKPAAKKSAGKKKSELDDDDDDKPVKKPAKSELDDDDDKPSKKMSKEDDEDDDIDDEPGDDDDGDKPVKKPAKEDKKPAKKPSKKKDEDEDEESKPEPKKKAKEEDDEDDDELISDDDMKFFKGMDDDGDEDEDDED